MRILRRLGALILLALLGLVMNFAATFVDSPALRQHAAQGLNMLREAGATPQAVGGFAISQADNFSSVLILKTAAYTGAESRLARTLGGFRVDLPAAMGEDAWDAFCRYADGRQSPTGGLSYTRYWHGYTLPLRLLLSLTTLSNVQMLLLFAQLALSGAILAMLGRRAPGLIAPFLCAFFLMMPPVTGTCLQFAPVTLLMLAGCALLLLWPALAGEWAFFAALGMATCYLDLLTFPTVTLSFSLTLALALGLGEGLRGRALARRSVVCAAAWGMGYAGMWAAKWALIALLLPLGASGVWAQLALRLSARSGSLSFSRAGALLENLRLITGKTALRAVLLLGTLAALLPRPRRAAPRALCLLWPALLPVLFMLATANHIHDHPYFTYRNLAGTVFAALATVSLALHPAGSGERKDDGATDLLRQGL